MAQKIVDPRKERTPTDGAQRQAGGATATPKYSSVTKIRLVLLRRFYLITILVVVTLFTGMATGFGLFYRLVYVLALTMMLSYIWSWLSVRLLEVTVDRRTPRVRVGDNVEERLMVRNLSRIFKSALEVEDLTDLPGYASGRIVSVGPRGSTTWETAAPARKRGTYTLGPVRVAAADPFGLFRREGLFCDTETIVVYPRTFDLPRFAIPAAELSGDSSLKKRTHDLTPHASSVRDYSPGDSISRVHWNSTARMGKLMSKDFDLGRASDVWVVVDLHRDVQVGELEESTDEYSVSIGASLARHYLQAALPVGLLVYGDQRHILPSDTGKGQSDRMMDHLAMSKAEGEVPLGEALAKDESLWGHHSSVVVITPSPRPEWVRVMRELARRRVKAAAVLVDGSSFGGFFDTLDTLGELYAAGIPTYVVRKGDHIPSALANTQSLLDGDAAYRPEELKVPL